MRIDAKTKRKQWKGWQKIAEVIAHLSDAYSTQINLISWNKHRIIEHWTMYHFQGHRLFACNNIL